MSRSKLRDKYMRNIYGENNEEPKNKVSKYIKTKCANAEWYQEPGSFDGHRPKRGGHRIVSGIIRQKNKEEIRKTIEE